MHDDLEHEYTSLAIEIVDTESLANRFPDTL